MLTAPLTNPDINQYARQLAAVANSATRGELGVTGQFTLKTGETSYLLRDRRCAVHRALFLQPVNEEAAKLQWYVPEMLKGNVTIQFVTAPANDAKFFYIIIGDGLIKETE